MAHERSKCAQFERLDPKIMQLRVGQVHQLRAVDQRCLEVHVLWMDDLVVDQEVMHLVNAPSLHLSLPDPSFKRSLHKIGVLRTCYAQTYVIKPGAWAR